MNCTCSLVALPVPTIAFLTSAGGNSWIASPAASPASRMTPRAWPKREVVRTLRE